MIEISGISTNEAEKELKLEKRKKRFRRVLYSEEPLKRYFCYIIYDRIY